MESLQDWFTEIHREQGFMIKPLIVGSLVSVVCSLVGCFIVLRRMSFLSDVIAHSMLTGVVGGYLLMKLIFQQEAHVGAMLAGAFLAGIVTVALIGFVTRVSRVKEDTAIGIMYTGIFAAGAVVVSTKAFSKLVHIDLYHFLVGNVLTVGTDELRLLSIVTVIVVGAIVLFYRPLQLTSFDPVMAASIGVPVLAMDYLLTGCASLVVVSGVRVAGVILVVALIITPAASAYLMFDRLKLMLIASSVIALIGFWIGFFLADFLGGSPGPCIVVSSTAIFGICLLFAPKHGLLADRFRKSRVVSAEVMEDILGAIYRNKAQSIEFGPLCRHVAAPRQKINRALKQLIQQNQVMQVDAEYRLTENGKREAKRLMRAHRLWETYLRESGVPEESIHDEAHVLEHLQGNDAIDYLDDKLGHPITDPHGSLIPAEFDASAIGQSFLVSHLRDGNVGKVTAILVDNSEFELELGEKIRLGPRIDDEKTWTIIRENGEKLMLSHEQADAVRVKLLEL